MVFLQLDPMNKERSKHLDVLKRETLLKFNMNKTLINFILNDMKVKYDKEIQARLH